MRDRQAPRRALAALCAVLILGGIFVPERPQAAVIADRVKAVTREYPHGSYFHDWVTVSYVKNGVLWHYTGHECAGFVMHVTKKAFQKPYYIGSPDYGLVYKTVSTKNTEEMKTLFSYAKIGDVIRWTGRGPGPQSPVIPGPQMIIPDPVVIVPEIGFIDLNASFIAFHKYRQ